jgi:membrane glycosyltransferase
VMMLIQSRFVFDVFLGRDSGWNAQNRDDQAMPLADCVKTHAMHVVTGIVFGVLSFHISWPMFLWMLPIAAALVLSPLVSWASGVPEFGRILYRWNVFRIPEETAPAPEAAAVIAEEPEVLLQAAE